MAKVEQTTSIIAPPMVQKAKAPPPLNLKGQQDNFEEEKEIAKDLNIDQDALRQVMEAERNQALNDEELARQLQNEINNDDSDEDEEEQYERKR